MEHNIVEVAIVFNGLYKWGEGWNVNTQKKWDEFLNSLDSSYWNFVRIGDGVLASDHLVSTSGNVFLHPMDFHAYIPCVGKSFRYVDGVEVETFPYVEDLIDIARKLAEHCGGSITIERYMLHTFDDEGNCKNIKISH